MTEQKLDFSFHVPNWPFVTLEVQLDPKEILDPCWDLQHDIFLLRRKARHLRVRIFGYGIVTIYPVDHASPAYASSSPRSNAWQGRIDCFLYFLQCVRDVIHVMHNRLPCWTISNWSYADAAEKALGYFLPLEDALRQKFPPDFYDSAEIISGSDVLPAIEEVFEMLVPLLTADTLGGRDGRV